MVKSYQDAVRGLELLSDASEMVHYDEPGIALYIRRGVLSDFPDHRADCHWHEDLEFIHILEGEMDYAVDGARISLQKGDILFVNARRLHYGWGPRGKECVFTCVLVDPGLLTANETMRRKLILPLTEDETRPFILFSPGNEGYERAAAHMNALRSLKAGGRRGYQLLAVGELAGLTLEIGEAAEGLPSAAQDDERLAAAKKMVACIQTHFAEDLTLDDIAAAGSVSRSTCCRLFKAYVLQTPIRFLNDFRLRAARERLERTDLGITRIAAECGFGDAGYFTRQFRAAFGCTPKEYRRKTAENKKQAGL